MHFEKLKESALLKDEMICYFFKYVSNHKSETVSFMTQKYNLEALLCEKEKNKHTNTFIPTLLQFS